jgi:hypothetical protein
MFYIRWPNGQHTLALAQNKDDLWDLLDESGDPGGCLLKELRRHRFAFDFVPREEGEGEEKHVAFKYEGGYESLGYVQDECVDLPAEKLMSGAEFFKGCFDARLPNTSEEVKDNIAKQLGVTR